MNNKNSILLLEKYYVEIYAAKFSKISCPVKFINFLLKFTISKLVLK